MEWLVIEKNAEDKIFTPYSEIIVGMYLSQQKTA